jgi:mono/diheme cytochrome c family protein
MRVFLVMGVLPVCLAAAPSVHDLDAQYRFSCAQCHGLDGTARNPAGLRLPGRVLADRKWLGQQKDEDLLRSILEGKGAMPSFKHKLGREEALGLLSEIIRPLARRARKDPRPGSGAEKPGE